MVGKRRIRRSQNSPGDSAQESEGAGTNYWQNYRLCPGNEASVATGTRFWRLDSLDGSLFVRVPQNSSKTETPPGGGGGIDDGEDSVLLRIGKERPGRGARSVRRIKRTESGKRRNKDNETAIVAADNSRPPPCTPSGSQRGRINPPMQALDSWSS